MLKTLSLIGYIGMVGGLLGLFVMRNLFSILRSSSRYRWWPFY